MRYFICGRLNAALIFVKVPSIPQWFSLILLGMPQIKSEYPSLTAISAPSVMAINQDALDIATRAGAFTFPHGVLPGLEQLQAGSLPGSLPQPVVTISGPPSRTTSPVPIRSRSVSPTPRAISPAPRAISPAPPAHAASPAPSETSAGHQPIQCYTTIMKNTAKGL